MKWFGKGFHKALYIRDVSLGFKYASMVNLTIFVVPVIYKKWLLLFLGACRNHNYFFFATPVPNNCLFPSRTIFSLFYFSQSSKFKFSSGKSSNEVFEVPTI